MRGGGSDASKGLAPDGPNDDQKIGKAQSLAVSPSRPSFGHELQVPIERRPSIAREHAMELGINHI
jgi:hypothetical protein